MGEVKRWTPEVRQLDDFCDPEPGMAECRDGEWVSHDDHAAEVTRMRERIAELEAQAADVDHACRVLRDALHTRGGGMGHVVVRADGSVYAESRHGCWSGHLDDGDPKVLPSRVLGRRR